MAKQNHRRQNQTRPAIRAAWMSATKRKLGDYDIIAAHILPMIAGCKTSPKRDFAVQTVNIKLNGMDSAFGSLHVWW